jgi:hypothetical protein
LIDKPRFGISDNWGAYFVQQTENNICQIFVRVDKINMLSLPGIGPLEDHELAVLVHELQHYKQFAQGRMHGLPHGARLYNGILYPLKNYITFDEYLSLPWEQNANTVANYVIECLGGKEPVVRNFWHYNENVA